MIWAVPANLKQIHDQGRHYRWPRPESCPRCRNWRVWGHGYAERYFDGFAEALRVRCYRCPACGCVITLRPESHFPRIRSPRQVIRECLQNPEYTGHPIRFQLDTQSGTDWTVIPVLSGHRFRF